MANSNRVSWETDLRKSIRSNYGQGWTVIGENSGRTKLTYQYPNEANDFKYDRKLQEARKALREDLSLIHI